MVNMKQLPSSHIQRLSLLQFRLINLLKEIQTIPKVNQMTVITKINMQL